VVTDVEMEWAELWAGDVHGSVREGMPSMVAHTVLNELMISCTSETFDAEFESFKATQVTQDCRIAASGAVHMQAGILQLLKAL